MWLQGFLLFPVKGFQGKSLCLCVTNVLWSLFCLKEYVCFVSLHRFKTYKVRHNNVYGLCGVDRWSRAGENYHGQDKTQGCWGFPRELTWGKTSRGQWAQKWNPMRSGKTLNHYGLGKTLIPKMLKPFTDPNKQHPLNNVLSQTLRYITSPRTNPMMVSPLSLHIDMN